MLSVTSNTTHSRNSCAIAVLYLPRNAAVGFEYTNIIINCRPAPKRTEKQYHTIAFATTDDTWNKPPRPRCSHSARNFCCTYNTILVHRSKNCVAPRALNHLWPARVICVCIHMHAFLIEVSAIA